MSYVLSRPISLAIIVFLLIETPAQSQSRDQLPPPDFDVATAEFSTNIAYSDAISRLDTFFKGQITLGADKIFPKVSQTIHFEIWRNMWFEFVPKNPTGLQIKIVSWELKSDEFSSVFLALLNLEWVTRWHGGLLMRS
jgi:hypothetical protein